LGRSDRRRIAVLSDLHANGRALSACLAQADADGWDDLVIAGDLLTYGPDGAATLDVVAARVAKGAIVLSGNHDDLYVDLRNGDDRYYRSLPPWLRESVDCTRTQVDLAALAALPWRPEYVVGPVLIAHANPFGPRNYRYLNTDADHVEANAALGARGMRLGVHGHTHRAKVHVQPLGFEQPTCRRLKQSEGPGTVNAGSVGQPRSADKRASFLMVEIDRDELSFEHRFVDYDVAAHVAALAALPIAQPTRDKLASFFLNAPAARQDA
jgi:predicted phosphodiesterase